MEYIPMSAHRLIADYRRNHKILPVFYIKLFTYQMLRGLGYLHVQGVVSQCSSKSNAIDVIEISQGTSRFETGQYDCRLRSGRAENLRSRKCKATSEK
jgi:hypothetical protein